MRKLNIENSNTMDLDATRSLDPVNQFRVEDIEELLKSIPERNKDDIYWDGEESLPDCYEEVMSYFREPDVWDGSEELPECFQEVMGYLSDYDQWLFNRDAESYEGNDSEEEENIISDESDECEETECKGKSSKSSSQVGVKRALVIVSVVCGVIIIALSLMLFLGSRGGNSSSDLAMVQSKIDGLYTSSSKDGLKDSVTDSDVTSCESLLEKEGYSSQTKDYYKSLSSELDTIKYYMVDSQTLKTLENKDYDMTMDGYEDRLQDAMENTDNYTVSGLALSVYSRCNKLLDEYNKYTTLKDELENYRDVSTFNASLYKNRIKEIYHVPNVREVRNLYNGLVSKQKIEASKKEKESKADEVQIQSLQKEVERLKSENAQLLSQQPREIDVNNYDEGDEYY